MAKDKKKKSDKKKSKGQSMAATLKTLGNNQLVSDVVAAALVATAAALKDPNKARRFASEAGDQLEKLSKEGAERGGAMWQLALDVGRRALDSMSGEAKPKTKRAKPKTATKTKAVAAKRKTAAKAKTAAKPKTAAAKPKAAAKRKPATKRKPAAAKPRAKAAAKKA